MAKFHIADDGSVTWDGAPTPEERETAAAEVSKKLHDRLKPVTAELGTPEAPEESKTETEVASEKASAGVPAVEKGV